MPAKPIDEDHGERPGRERGHPEPECESSLRFVAHARHSGSSGRQWVSHRSSHTR